MAMGGRERCLTMVFRVGEDCSAEKADSTNMAVDLENLQKVVG